MQERANDPPLPPLQLRLHQRRHPRQQRRRPVPMPLPIEAAGWFFQRGQTNSAIIYDSDFGRDIDAVLALAVLSNLGAKGTLAAIAVSNSSLEAAAFCDAVSRFYAGESSGPFGGRRYS